MLLEDHLNQRAAGDAARQFVFAVLLAKNGGQDAAALRVVAHRDGAGRQVRLQAFLEVEGELRRGQQVGVPVALAR